MIQRAPSTTEKRKCEREYEEQEAMKTKLLKIVEMGEKVKKNSIFVPNVAFTRLGEIKKSDFGWLEIRFRFYISLKDIYRENIRHNYLIIQGIRILLISCRSQTNGGVLWVQFTFTFTAINVGYSFSKIYFKKSQSVLLKKVSVVHYTSLHYNRFIESVESHFIVIECLQSNNNQEK